MKTSLSTSPIYLKDATYRNLYMTYISVSILANLCTPRLISWDNCPVHEAGVSKHKFMVSKLNTDKETGVPNFYVIKQVSQITTSKMCVQPM